MSFLSTIARLYRALRDGYKYAKLICRIAAKMDAKIQASNASSELKAQSTATLGNVNALCTAVENYIASLND